MLASMVSARAPVNEFGSPSWRLVGGWARLSLLCLGLAAASCTTREDSGPKAKPAAPESPESPEPQPAPTPEATMDTKTISGLDELARSCAGAELRDRLTALSPAQLTALAKLPESEAPSLRLLAIWERARSFSSEGNLTEASVTPLVAAIEAELGVAPPSWWVEQLRAAKLRPDADDGPPYYDVGLTTSGDRRGDWEPGPGGTRVRAGSGSVLSASGGQLGYDLSMGRVELGPLPEAHTMIEHARALAGTTIYYATFSQGSGGFRFPLRAVAADSSLRWEAEVCGPDRKILGGHGHLTVEILVLEQGAATEGGGPKMGHGKISGVAVYTAESHGIALEVFDPETGARTLAWSSDFWFSR
jgi:hypothetical protein